MRPLAIIAWIGTALVPSAHAANLLVNGSFEAPAVTGRVPERDGGSTLRAAQKGSWKTFAADPSTDGGQLIMGLTNEVAHSGKQSLFVDFNKVTASEREAVLGTELIPVKADRTYRVSSWARIDRKRPLALDERRPFLVLELHFFESDQKTEVGEPIQGPQIIPGIIVPGGPHQLIFVSGKWSESYARVTTPEKAAFLQVTWTWMTPKEEGETDGVLYWDDASLEEEPDQPAPSPAAVAPPVPNATPSPAVPNLISPAPGKPAGK